MSVRLPPGTKAKMCDVSITRHKLRVGLKGQEPIISVSVWLWVTRSTASWHRAFWGLHRGPAVLGAFPQMHVVDC